MSVTTCRQSPFFTIQRLTEVRKATIGDRGEDIIGIYLVLNGCLTITDKRSCSTLTANHLYWAGYDRFRRIIPEPDAEGYAIRFSRSFLQTTDAGSLTSCLAAFCPLPLTGDTIQLEKSFLDEGRGLCELMRQEFDGCSDFKTQVLRSLLSIFLLHLVRRSNILMVVSVDERRLQRATSSEALLFV